VAVKAVVARVVVMSNKEAVVAPAAAAQLDVVPGPGARINKFKRQKYLI
jgi:hypothetical protein